MSSVTAEIARKHKELQKCADELQKISKGNEEKYINPAMIWRARERFKISWAHKTTEQLKKKICYIIALITLIDEEIERRKE